MPDTKPLSGRSVLVLEDDYYLAEDAKATLESAGATVLGPFRAVDSALDAARNGNADCAVVDINLGGGPNFAPAESLLRMGVPVVFITGYDDSVIPEALSHVPCLQKPTQPHRIIDAVRQTCAA